MFARRYLVKRAGKNRKVGQITAS